jgi:hypothetical protein
MTDKVIVMDKWKNNKNKVEVTAYFINYSDYTRYKGFMETSFDIENKTLEGYQIFYPNGNVGWASKEIFEETYSQITGKTNKFTRKTNNDY